MEIKKTQNISFEAFFRHSPPCMHYLEKNFDGNKMRFNKALEILDERCSKHKFFDIIFSSENNAVRIIPKEKKVDKYLPNGHYIWLPQSEHYSQIHNIGDISAEYPKKSDGLFLKFLKNLFSLKKAKKIINPYYKLPANVREAVDIVEKIERSIV